MPYRGELFALLTAVCWTGSSTAFAIASRAAGPLPSNQFRLLAALPVLFAIVWATTGQPWPIGVSDERIALLAASGLVGLVLGDVGFFHALATIGPRLSSVVMATWPAFTIAIEACRGHLPGAMMLAGVALTMAGVGLVLLRSREGAWNPTLTRRQLATGIAGALVGALGQAGGVVLAKVGMDAAADLPGGVLPLQATFVRMCAAVVGLQLLATVQRQPFAFTAVFGNRTALSAALLGAVFGPIAGVWLSMAAVQNAAHVGVASTLMATTPIFMMPVAWFAYGARVGALGIFGTVVAVVGVGVCFLAR